MKRTLRTPTSLEISPKEFLYHLEFGMDRISSRKGVKIVVKGDLELEGNDNIVEIPEAEVTGHVRIARCMSLSSCSLRVGKKLAILDCPSLQSLSGKSSELLVERSGIAVLGADFETSGDAKIAACPGFSKINCHVGGSLTVEGSGQLAAGPAFSCGVVLQASGGLVFASLGRGTSPPPSLGPKSSTTKIPAR